MKPIKHVYVAGPFSADPIGCTARAVAAGLRLSRAGYAPFVPHVACEFMGTVDGYEAAMTLCMGWLDRCDAIVRLPGHSPGADREVERARALGIPVFHGVEAFLASRARPSKQLPPPFDLHAALAAHPEVVEGMRQWLAARGIG